LQRHHTALTDTATQLEHDNASLRMQLDDLSARFRRQTEEAHRLGADTNTRLERERDTLSRALEDTRKCALVML
jgi:ABC-type transporter Mla subunit MlaD